MEYEDINFKKQRGKFQGWTAQIIQHECDHLGGNLDIMLDLKQLKYFIVCVETGSISEAARLLLYHSAKCEQSNQGLGK
mgnify:CR=1 FL=1